MVCFDKVLWGQGSSERGEQNHHHFLTDWDFKGHSAAAAAAAIVQLALTLTAAALTPLMKTTSQSSQVQLQVTLTSAQNPSLWLGVSKKFVTINSTASPCECRENSNE